ncbi:hypothetical protein DdX_08876 [Ditylenchus destructor]|uniref:Uncharacterized protein n=1 Tax=Ditylenchus destructor TaxID=166010 RepID=A0AAD4R6S1_9BILA|nr:hypothetical protein DdX_08876 [Ditylenchus destructor]
MAVYIKTAKLPSPKLQSWDENLAFQSLSRKLGTEYLTNYTTNYKSAFDKWGLPIKFEPLPTCADACYRTTRAVPLPELAPPALERLHSGAARLVLPAASRRLQLNGQHRLNTILPDFTPVYQLTRTSLRCHQFQLNSTGLRSDHYLHNSTRPDFTPESIYSLRLCSDYQLTRT